MNILALDLGTKMGHAYNIGADFVCGTWILATAKEIKMAGKERLNRRNDPRFKKLCEILSGLPEFDIVIFEDVEFSSYRLQMQLWAGLRSAVNLCAKTKYFDCVSVSTLKKFATGHGGATKEMMCASLKKRGLWLPYMDDNAIDAAWLYVWAKQNLGRTKI